MCNDHINIDGATTDLTVFDIVLLRNRTVNQDIDQLATVGTLHLFFFQRVHRTPIILQQDFSSREIRGHNTYLLSPSPFGPGFFFFKSLCKRRPAFSIKRSLPKGLPVRPCCSNSIPELP